MVGGGYIGVERTEDLVAAGDEHRLLLRTGTGVEGRTDERISARTLVCRSYLDRIASRS